MARRAPRRSAKADKRRTKRTTNRQAGRSSVKRQKKTRVARRSGGKKAKATARKTPRASRTSKPTSSKAPRLERARRTLEEVTIPSPPSSLNMNRHGSAARSGRAEMLDERMKQGRMTSVTAGDLDVNAEDAYFTGDEAPGGDNSTPDQDVVDDIGKAVGIQYQDDEELKASDKVAERDKHRWELDPASSEDYKGRK
jgi:uncharacterized protein DUF6335